MVLLTNYFLTVFIFFYLYSDDGCLAGKCVDELESAFSGCVECKSSNEDDRLRGFLGHILHYMDKSSISPGYVTKFFNYIYSALDTTQNASLVSPYVYCTNISKNTNECPAVMQAVFGPNDYCVITGSVKKLFHSLSISILQSKNLPSDQYAFLFHYMTHVKNFMGFNMSVISQLGSTVESFCAKTGETGEEDVNTDLTLGSGSSSTSNKRRKSAHPDTTLTLGSSSKSTNYDRNNPF